MLTQQDQVVLTSLEIVISLLVFGIGIPALIFDRPQWLRRIRDHHSMWSRYPIYAGVILSAIALILTSFIISTPNFFGCFGQSSTQPSYLCPYIYRARLHAHSISGYLIILSTAITLGSWGRLLFYRTEYVARKVGNIALENSPRQRFVRWSRFRFYDVAPAEKEKCIEDLGIIGRTVEIDDDRHLVLETLKKLTAGDLLFDARDPSYPLLRAHVKALLKTASDDNLVNQSLAIGIMKILMLKAIARNDFSVQIVPPYLIGLGRRIISLENDELDHELWEVVQSGASIHHAEPLFDWSILALSLGRERTATIFTHSLEVQTEAIISNDTSTGLQFAHSPEIAYLFVGLVAHFCTMNGAGAGETRRNAGLHRLVTTFNGFEADMDSLFSRGIDFFELRSDFITVDRIVELRTNFNTHQP